MGLREEEGKQPISSLLPLSPLRSLEVLVEPRHFPSSPPAPRSWGVCYSPRAAQEGWGRLEHPTSTEPACNGDPMGHGGRSGALHWKDPQQLNGLILHAQDGAVLDAFEGKDGHVKGDGKYKPLGLRQTQPCPGSSWSLWLMSDAGKHPENSLLFSLLLSKSPL